MEVRYLYATEAMVLYGPANLLRIRDDKAASECTMDQLRAVQRGLILEV